MGKLFLSLFFLPIYRQAQDEYYRRNAEKIEKQKKEFDETSPVPFDELNHNDKTFWLDKWELPPWQFNNVVGYLDVGINIGNDLVAFIFLKRKFLPKSDRRKGGGNTAKNNEFVYFSETIRVPIKDRKSNNSYLYALEKIFYNCRELLKQNGKKHKLWTPIFDFNCLNFVEACQQAKKNHK